MNSVARFYFSFAPWALPLWPMLVVAAGVRVTRRMSKYRWAVHLLVLVAILSAPLAFVSIGAILDPTWLELPGPGDGFLLLIYLVIAAPAIFAYASYAFVHALAMRKKTPSPVTSTV